MIRISSAPMKRNAMRVLSWLGCFATIALLGLTHGCSTSSGSNNNNNNGGNGSPTTRVLQSTMSTNVGQTGRLTLNAFSNGFVTGSFRFVPNAGGSAVTFVLNGNFNTTTLAFSITGQAKVNGTNTTITVSGTLPSSNAGGTAQITFNGSTYQGSFNTASDVGQGQMVVSEVATPTNANTGNLTFGHITASLSAVTSGQQVAYEARIGSGNTSRVLNIIIASTANGGFATGQTFPIHYTTVPGSYATTIVYGEQGTFATGYVRSWVARSGTVIIDSVSQSSISMHLINARFEPFTEVAGNPATGSFTVNYHGATTNGTGGGNGGNGGGSGGGNSLSKVLLANIPMSASQNGVLNLNVLKDNTLSGTFRFTDVEISI